MQKIKPWLYPVLPNIMFFGLFCGAMIYEAATHINTNQTGDSFLFLLPVYIIIYAIFTYKSTKKVLLPNLCFAVFMFAFLIITDYYTAAFSGFYDYSSDIITGVLFIFAIFTVVPTLLLLLIQLLIRFIYTKMKK